MDIKKFPRRRYTERPTPIEKLERLSALFSGPDIYIKRDDLLGLAGGGNKTRKLEFLLADALAKGADTIITCGAPQSNHCRLTLSAAIKEGLACQLVLAQQNPAEYNNRANGNVFLFHLLGAEKLHVVDLDEDIDAFMQQLAAQLRAQGRKPYVIPMGGSNELGALGYVAAAQEILQQTQELGLYISHIVCTCGSAGTQAGLLVGLAGSGMRVIGISTSRPQKVKAEMTLQLAERTATLLGVPNPPAAADVVVLDDYVGEGYAIPSPQMAEAVELTARREGILLDPVYTGKTMAGVLDLLKQGYFGNSGNILFLHTGGSPALYAYTNTFYGG